MKKTIWSLAALILTTAIVMTSCDKEHVQKKQGKEVTLTIAFPDYDETTKVGIGGDYKLTGWELNDEVVLYQFENVENSSNYIYEEVKNAVTLRCTNASTGTFSGTLPEGVENLNDYKAAVFNATAEGGQYSNPQEDYHILVLKPKNQISANMKDVIVMAAYKDNDSYHMQVVGNIMKLDNRTGNPIEAAVVVDTVPWNYLNPQYASFAIDPDMGVVVYQYNNYTGGFTGKFSAVKFTIPTGESYKYIAPCYFPRAGGKIGICNEDDCTSDTFGGNPSVVPFKSYYGFTGYINAKLWNYTILP